MCTANALSLPLQASRCSVSDEQLWVVVLTQLEYPDFTAFYTTPMPKFFIFEEDDVSLLLGNNRWLDFADRLREANNGVGNSTVIAVHGDHQGMLTRPASIAAGIVEAAILPLQQTR